MSVNGRIDTREIEELVKQLEKAERATSVFIEKCVKELSARLLRAVKQRTPIGKYKRRKTRQGGTYKKQGGTLRRGWTTCNVTRKGSVYSIQIINPINYASYVEYGHRKKGGKGWVKGRFMLKISEDEINSMTPSILERRLDEWIRSCIQ